MELEFRNTTNLWAHSSTVACALKGCTVCCYKIIVKLPKDELGKPIYRNCKQNQRPENCLRLKNDSKSFNLCKAFGLNSLESISILIVGDGNMTFGLSMFSQLVKESSFKDMKLITSTYFSKKQLIEVYPDAAENVEKLEKLENCSLLYNIDATKLSMYKELSKDKFDFIFFNFPCVDVKVGNDAQSENLKENLHLVQEFLENSTSLLAEGELSKVVITHKTKEPFSWWDLDKMESTKLNFDRKVVFDKTWFPNYKPRKVRFEYTRNSKNSFPVSDAVMYIYQTKPSVTSSLDQMWNSDLISKNEFLAVTESNIIQTIHKLQFLSKTEETKRKRSKSQKSIRKRKNR